MELNEKTQVALLQILAKLITGTTAIVDTTLNIDINKPLPVIIDGAGSNLYFNIIGNEEIITLSESLGDLSLVDSELFEDVNGNKFELIHNISNNIYYLVLGNFDPININEDIEKSYEIIALEDLFVDLKMEYEDHIG